MNSETTPKTGWFGKVRGDVLPSIVVFLVALPLCMGISIASGVPVAAGLVTGIVGGLVVGLLAGAPLQVSGPAAGLTVVIYDLVTKHGLESLGVVVFMAGGIQVLAGMLKLGQWFRAVSPAVIKGMLAGIGVLILASQFHVMVDDSPKGSGWENLVTIPEAVKKGLPWPNVGTPEEREIRTEKLKQFGTLHNRQIEIQEEVGEVVPELSTKLSDEAQAEQLALLAEKQQALNAALNTLSVELDAELVTKDEQAASKLREATRAALSAGEVALVDLQQAEVPGVRQTQAAAELSLRAVLNGLKNHDWAAKIGIFTILLIILWQTAVPKKWKIVPAPLVAVTLATAITAVLSLPVLYVEVPMQLLDDLHVPTLSVLTGGDWPALLQAAVVVAIVASAETLLCATAVDQMHQGKRTQYDRELCAQGAGNVLCGLMGALPMTGVIVRSATNIHAGGKTRWSAVMHGLWLLVFVVLLAGLLRMIPIAALAAMLVYTGFKLVDLKSLRTLAEYGKGEVFIYFATVGTIVATDLLKGVLVGISLSAAKLLFTVSRLRVDVTTEPERKEITVHLHGIATFLQLPLLAEELEGLPRRHHVHVVEEQLVFIDHACLDLVMSWSKQYCMGGGDVTIDLEGLHAKCRAYQQPQIQTQLTNNKPKAAQPVSSVD